MRMISLLFLTLVTGCEALGIVSLSDQEEAVVGDYSLQTLNDAVPPVLSGTLPPSSGVPQGCPVYVDRGGFELEDDRSYEAWFIVRSVCPPPPSGNGTVIDEVRQTGKWKLRGSTLELSDKTGTSYNYDRDVTADGATINASIAIEWVGTLNRQVAVFSR